MCLTSAALQRAATHSEAVAGDSNEQQRTAQQRAAYVNGPLVLGLLGFIHSFIYLYQ